MGPLVYLAKNMARKNFSKFSGIVMGLGGLGALFAFNPFYLITIEIGWRNSFFIFSFLIAIICFILVLLLKFKKKKNSSQKQKDGLHTFVFIFTNKKFFKKCFQCLFLDTQVSLFFNFMGK